MMVLLCIAFNPEATNVKRYLLKLFKSLYCLSYNNTNYKQLLKKKIIIKVIRIYRITNIHKLYMVKCSKRIKIITI